MRHVNGDEGDLGFLEDVRDVRSDVLLHLKFQHQVDALAHKFLGILDGHIGIIAIVQLQQFHTGSCGSRRYACAHCNRKRHLRTLRGESETQSSWAARQGGIVHSVPGQHSHGEPAFSESGTRWSWRSLSADTRLPA